jgi:hypothetical protein
MGRPAERASRTARSLVSASIAILGLPSVIAAHTAASHIHAGISRDRPGRTSLKRIRRPARACRP